MTSSLSPVVMGVAFTNLLTPLFLPPVLGTARGSLELSLAWRSRTTRLQDSNSDSDMTGRFIRVGRGSNSYTIIIKSKTKIKMIDSNLFALAFLW